ncbi:MAG TPA: DUF5615 family PIN-like protein [Thioalkalivibrio sp.]|nr:DUF5615 family PIN-like protein [Thioalkalivibrio sp.]
MPEGRNRHATSRSKAGGSACFPRSDLLVSGEHEHGGHSSERIAPDNDHLRLARVTILYCPLPDAIPGGCATAPALARWLSARGCPADHVAALGMGASMDRIIWEWASKEGVMIATKDEGFAIWRIAYGVGTPPVV